MLEGGSGGNGESRGGKREFARGLADFAAALALFWLAVFAVSGSDIRAHAVSLPTLASEAILPEAATPSRIGAYAVESRPLRPWALPRLKPAGSKPCCC